METGATAKAAASRRTPKGVTVDVAKSGATMRTELLRFNDAVERDPAINAWMKEHEGELGAIAHQWFEVMRKCGTKSGSFCMTAVRLRVWEMRPSATSMYSPRT